MCYGNYAHATLRSVKVRRPSGLTLLAAALLLMMPALAVLQFRWVGQVSDAEKDRMQRNVNTAVLQFRTDFQNEIRRAFDLTVGAATVRDGNWEAYANRYDRWTTEAAHPQMVKSVYLVMVDGAGLASLKWDDESRTFAKVDWPTALEPWRDDFAAELADFNAGRGPQQQTRFRDQDSLLVAPVGSTFTVQPGARRSVQVFGYTVIELDLPYLRNELVPELADAHFSHPTGDSYRVAVVTNDDAREVIYRSSEESTLDQNQADATTGFFQGRFGTGRPGPPAQRANAPGAAPDRRQPPTAGDQSITAFPGRWRILVQHPSGSLEAAVAGVRRRNLALSFGVLILLTISIGLLTITSRKAQRLAEQQIEFVAGVSHELRTPVAVIRSAAENLSHGVVGSTERVKRYGLMIEGEARRLGEMVERVLQYAGIQSGLGYGARTALAPAEIIQSAVDSAIPLVGPDTVDIHRDIPDSLPTVTGDAAALRSAVQNLVANAVKYGGEDRWVGIRAEHVRENRRSEVHITVSDHGAGIPASELPHIFEPFYRGGDALARQIHGNGLGLSLVKRIVAAHGGRVTVETRSGVGSSFTISLPAAQPDVASTSVAGEMRAAAHS